MSPLDDVNKGHAPKDIADFNTSPEGRAKEQLPTTINGLYTFLKGFNLRTGDAPLIIPPYQIEFVEEANQRFGGTTRKFIIQKEGSISVEVEELCIKVNGKRYNLTNELPNSEARITSIARNIADAREALIMSAARNTAAKTADALDDF